MNSRSRDLWLSMRTVVMGAFLACTVFLSPAHAQNKRAVVIGNADYQNFGYQQDLLFDADLMSASLRDAGFDVEQVNDANLDELQRVIRDFTADLDALGEDGVGLFIFSGLVLQGFGTNFLMPVGVETGADFRFDDSAIDIDQAVQKMSGNQTGQRIFVIDARRNEILTKEFGISLEISTEIAPPLGSFIVFSNGLHDSTDSETTPDTFAEAIAERIPQPHSSIETLFAAIEQDVEETPGGEGTVWARSGLVKTVSLSAPVSPARLKLGSVRPSSKALSASDDSMPGLSDVIGPIQPGPALAVMKSERIAGEETLDERIDVAKAGLADRAAEFDQSFIEVDRSYDDIISFSAKLTHGSDAVRGQSIEELIKGTPLYPPIAELPKELWENQTCSSCHQWDQANLCTQAGNYLGADGEASLRKQHPYGGSLKANLRLWAEDGCH